MRTRYYILITIVFGVMLGSCARNEKGHADFPKGYFDEWNYDNEVNNFATSIPIMPNGLKKITEGPLSYYTWRTIKADILIDSTNNEYFSAYRTMLQGEYAELNMEGKKYVRTAKNLLNNYLFILDDRRLIYISEDGARFDNFSQGGINLMYLESAACAEEEKYSTYSQAIRGYYSIDDNAMQIHFKGRKDFYVKAVVSDDFGSLRFDKVSLSSEDIDNADGLRNRYEDFSKIFSSIAQPIFELPDSDDQIIDSYFNLNLGLVHCTNMHPKLLAERSKMISELNIENPELYADRIVSIKYVFDQDLYQYQRHYECALKNLESFEEVQYSFIENLSEEMLTW